MKFFYILLLFLSSFLLNAQNGLLNGTGSAPNFTVSDVLYGDNHELYNYLDSGYVVVLDFLSITCGHCIMHTPGTINSYNTNGPNGNNTARFIGLEVNSSTDSLAVLNYINNYNIDFPIANDIFPYMINYEMNYTPTFYVIYPDRTYTTICYNCVTPTSASQIEYLLDNAISAWPPIYGCTDPTATNYDQSANVDDGSCNLTSYTIKTIGMSFSPDTIVCDVGDTINFILSSSHNAVEVDSSTFVTGGNTSNGGFVFGYGATGNFIPNNLQTYYYVCQPHASSGMVGVIIANNYGCTDPVAVNYDVMANVDDGNCDYSSYTIQTQGMSFLPDTIVCDVGDTINFILGPGHNAVEVIDSTWLSNDTTSLSGGFSFGYGSTGYFIPDNCQAFYYVCQPHAQQGMKGVVIAHFPPIDGCTDSLALNFDSLANYDDGTCCYISGCSDSLAINYDASACFDDGSCIIIVYGCTGPTYCNYNPLATLDDGSCTGWAGCMDPVADNYNMYANCNDGSCTYSNTCPESPITGLFIDGIIDDRVNANFDNMNTYDANGNQVCRVDQIRIQYRPVGTSAWSAKNIASPVGYDPYTGICNSTQATMKPIRNLTLATTYEWRVKVWYCSGGNGGWVDGTPFTTADECPNVANFTAYGANPTKATFDWDASNGVYDFVRIKLRLDSIQNATGSDWMLAGGFGVPYGTNTKNKNGLVAGETYRGQARTWCDPNGGAYNSLSWTPIVTWTQPTNRLEGGTAINNLDVYPNPSRDIYNITFTSENVQDIRIRVLNIIGEEIMNEDLQRFIGEYTKKINLKDNAKGLYFLEVETNYGKFNKKLILQ